MNKISKSLDGSDNPNQSAADSHSSALPSKKLVLVTCMDTRINPYELFNFKTGEVHILRNAGGIIRNDTLRSIAISQAALGTESVLVVQHTDCGMTKLDDSGIAELIERSSGAKPSVELGAFSDLKQSLHNSLKAIKDCEFITHRSDVRGFILDVETGELEEVQYTD